MPCRSDHMEPNAREIESRKVAGLLLYVQRKYDKNIHYSFGNDELGSISSNLYGDPGAVDGLTADLCDTLKELEKNYPDKFEEIVYNARDAKSRELADWWERHKAADRAREERERRQAEEKREREYAEYLRLKEQFEGK